MLIKAWRFMTLLLTALLMGMTFCHVLELPAKMQYDAAFYLTIHRSLYVAFGMPNLGALIEVGAILAAVGLVFLVRKDASAVGLTLAGAAALVAGLVVFFIFVEPANAALKAMMIQAPPNDFFSWRNQWEYGHVAHFALHLLGFSALLLSVLTARSTVPALNSDVQQAPSLTTASWQAGREQRTT